MKKVPCNVALRLSVVVVVMVMVVLLGDQVGVTEAVTCNIAELAPCQGVVTGPPSKECCEKLKEQEPCLCEYIKDPKLKPYFGNANARKVAAICGATIPTNC